jgi:hypothetical protein
MKLNNSLKIPQHIDDQVDKTYRYFNSLSVDDPYLFHFRVTKELSTNIKSIKETIYSTLLDYLDQDARKNIERLSDEQKLKYYNAEIRENIKLPSLFSENSSTNMPKSKKISVLLASVFGVSAFAGLFVKSSAFFISKSVCISFLFGVSALSFFVVPAMLKKKEMEMSKKELKAVLDLFKGKLKEECDDIIDQYTKAFENLYIDGEADV